MKKVGIMSMQRIYNYGSFLQAYGLRKIFQSLNTDVKFIDYHPGKPLVDNSDKNGILRKLSKALETLVISAPFKTKLDYINYKRTYAAKYYPLLGIKEERYYETNDLNLLVIGSDEVFNCVQDNPNVGFSLDLFGANCESKKLISYAASFGNTTLEKLIKYKKDKKIIDCLNKFDALSVRDRNSYSLVKQLIGKEPIENLDPVLTYEFIKKEDLPEVELPYKYLILYGYNGRFSKKECKKIKKFAKARGLKIVCIGGIQHYCDVFLNCAPLEVLSYFKNAEYVITDTFHGTIMSIITHRKFISFIRKNGYGNSQKLEDLLQRLNLKERILNNLDDIENNLNNYINYSKTDKIIENERRKAFSYLKSEIEKA